MSLSNVYDEGFFEKIVDGCKPLAIFAKKLNYSEKRGKMRHPDKMRHWARKLFSP